MSKPAGRVGRLGPQVIVLLVALVVSAIAGGVAYFVPVALTAIQSTGLRLDGPAHPSAAAPATPRPPDATFTVLLLGSDDDRKFVAGRVLTQSMILVRVDPAAKRATMLSIPRDLWVPLSNGKSGKIDLAYYDGGAPAAIATVSSNFDVTIDDYVWVGLKGMIDIVDALGGVNLAVTNPVLDDYYPADVGTDDPYGYERVAVLPGPQHLTGYRALQYVRSRHGDLQADFGRSRRQQQLLLAIVEKAKHASPAEAPALAAALRDEFKTSMGLDRIRALAPLVLAFAEPGAVEQLVLAAPYTHDGEVDGEAVLLPDWDLIRPLMRQRF